MLGVDDGIVNGNLDVADLFFLVAVILGVIAAVLSFPRTTPPAKSYAATAGWLAVACLGFGWFVL